MSDNPWYKWFIGDYDRKTAHLSLLEHGAYRLLIDHYYATKSPLPGDLKMLYRICKSFTPSERKAVQTVLSEFFTYHESGYINERCRREIDKLLKYSKSQSANAKRTLNDGLDEKLTSEHREFDHDFDDKSCHSVLNKELFYNDSPSAVAKPYARVSDPDRKKEEKPTTVGKKNATRFEITELPVDWADFCWKQRPELNPKHVFDRFRDYWIAQPGRNGLKTDWLATWRNWVRNEKQPNQQAKSQTKYPTQTEI